MKTQHHARHSATHHTLALLALLAALGAAGGCAHKQDTPPPPPPTERLKPSDVVRNLQLAYKRRNNVEYAKLLASDFQFWFDPATKPMTVPDFWTRLQDSTGTANLFAAGDITDIRITLTYGSDVPVNEVGRERWRKIRITDTFLEVDKLPPTGEVITFRVDGDVQDFYMRKGFTPDDTLASSPTAREWYLVEWHDLARLTAGAGDAAGASPGALSPGALSRGTLSRGTPAPATQEMTWSRIKGVFVRL